MSCSKYYRDCPKCKKDVHMNFYCDCGGDPWELDEEKELELIEVDSELGVLEGRVAVLKQRKEILSKALEAKK